MSIDVSTIVNIAILSAPTYPQLTGFGVPLIVGSSTYLPSGNRMRFYTSLTGVGGDFPTSSQEYLAAQAAFAQVPTPATVAIGRRFPNGAPAELLGSVNYDKTIADWTAITAGSLKLVTLDGSSNISLTNLNFSGVTTLTGVAAVVNTALNTALAGATCSFNGLQFVLRGAASSASGAITYSTNAATGTYIGIMLGTDATSLGTLTQGSAAESITQALSNLQAYNAGWYGFHFTNEVVDADLLLAMGWVMGYKKIMAYTSADSNIQAAGTTNDIASQAMTNGYSRVFGMWDQNNSYSALSAICRAFTVNFQGEKTTITLKFKQLSGMSVQNLSETQRQTLDAKHINYYCSVGGSPMLEQGVMADGTWFDQVHGLDWLQNAVETQVFGYLLTQPTKVMQTDKGVASVVQQFDIALAQAQTNGLLAPQIWQGQPLGQINTGDIVPNGYYTAAQPVSSQSLAVRDTRVAPAIQAIITGAGAIQGVNASITFQQ